MERVYSSSKRTERIEDRRSGGNKLTRKGSSRILLVVSFNPSESAFEMGVTISVCFSTSSCPNGRIA
jgi:hypothetical protein